MTTYPTHRISIGKGPDYVVFKEQSSPKLSIMPSCQPFANYNNETFTCDLCGPAEKTFGLQETQCQPCLTLKIYSWRDELNGALYDQLCADGSIKSIILVIATPFFVCLLGIICCVQTANANKRRVPGRGSESSYTASTVTAPATTTKDRQKNNYND